MGHALQYAEFAHAIIVRILMIKYIQIFGERCSGTNFVASLVNKNFRDVRITKEFGGKHWFIKDHYPRCRPNQSTDVQCVRSIEDDNSDTLFLCIFRNPFDWVRSLHSRPYHAYNHVNLPLSQFMRKPWLSYEKSRVNRKWPIRDDNYWFIDEAMNILKLRSLKNEHWLGLQNVVDNFCMINYDALVNNNQELANITSQFQIELEQPEIIGEPIYIGRPGDKPYAPPKYPAFSEGDLEFLQEELDWHLENQIGFHFSDYQN